MNWPTTILLLLLSLALRWPSFLLRPSLPSSSSRELAATEEEERIEGAAAASEKEAASGEKERTVAHVARSLARSFDG